MKKLLLILLCLPMIGFGQGWGNLYGTGALNWGNAIEQTNDSGFIITGYSEVLNNRDVYLIKIDINGFQQWSSLYGGFELDWGNSVKQTNDGGYIITGRYTYNMPNSEIYLIKTDENGIEQWSQTYTNGEGFSVQQTNDGGYIICNSGGLLKTNGNGIEQWRQTYIGNSFKSFQQTTDGGYIITGFSFGNGDWDVSLIKTDSNGIEQWNQTYFGSGYDRGHSVHQTNDGGYIVTGNVGPLNNWDIFLLKTDGNGDSLWTKTFGGSGSDEGNSVHQTNDGGYIICGQTESFGNVNSDVYLIKTDDSGNTQWEKTFGGTSATATGQYVIENNDGGYTICGSYMYDTCKVNVIKTDSQGNLTSTFNIPINPNRKLQKVVDVLGKEIPYRRNTPLFYIYDDGTVEKRIVIE